MAARIITYRTYRFIDKDPVIDKMRTIFEDEHLSVKEAATLSSLAQSTLHNLFFGGTISPRHSTVGAFISSLGYDQRFVKVEDLDLHDKELKKAADWLLKNRKKKRNGKR